jgi:hypothetical protein
MEQTLMKKWEERLFLYRDPKGCALYIDYPDGRMIRVANRPAESMLYVNIVSPAWTELQEQVGKSAQFGLFFRRGSMRVGQIALGQIIEQAGKYGYGGSNIGTDVLIDLAHEGSMEIEPYVDEKRLPTLTFDLTGIAPAIEELSYCS